MSNNTWTGHFGVWWESRGKGNAGSTMRHMRDAYSAGYHVRDAEVKALMLRFEELELWRDRYETLRKLNPRAFGELYALNLRGEKPFDQLVDELKPFVTTQTVDR